MNIYRTTFQSETGVLTLCATEKGICMIEFDNPSRIDKHLTYFRSAGYEIVDGTNDHLNKGIKQLQMYFERSLKTPDVPLDLIGSEFQISVWNELLKIPYGQTRTYKDQSIAIGNLKAIRAVAKANGENRISILVPCHRVIGANGDLVGYAGGIDRKRFLLDLESNQQKLF